MPVTIRKVKGGYEVRTPDMVHSKHTTLAKAQHQANLLRAVEHGWKPTGQASHDYMEEERLRTKPMRISVRRPRISPKRQKIGR